MKYIITSPNKSYRGESAGVHFVNGTAIVEDEKFLDWFKDKGYKVELMDNEPFVAHGKEIGKVEGDYITITDPAVIDETMEDDECIESTIKEIKGMKAGQLAVVAEDLGVDISSCKNVDEKKETIINFITAKNAELEKESDEGLEVTGQEQVTPEEVKE